ncbi:enoyl-CoA hydratase/isomerase family protein [Actinomadura sp. LD22]|uniref:Enoyl-CoA hydratase/isomerase family protein n=1 Tax=Actinomadura physcomitrii TaxID=2650748 RepID=A0A6I4MED2_9ACTN|nr:enoyl-CoA hydratase/isomerase family protein [Actinomadura physcomitrii]MWA03240.1 enoyl-CoA hydratase/isomerase family protein [Actinomadura physcomitrii]
MARYQAVEPIRNGPVGELRLCRPDVQNRFDDVLFGELGDALGELAADTEIRAVVLSAAGKHFSAGGDTETMLAANADLQVLLAQVDDGRRLFRAFADFPKPLIAALHGHVFGVATSLALTADAVVSAPGVRISDPHVHLGLVAGDGGCVTWPANLPLVRAKRHLLWGEPLLAEDAHRLGLVTELAESAEAVRPLALELAERVAALPPVAVQLTKRALNKVLAARADEVFDTAFYLEAISASTADLREAVEAFTQKRPGVWSGR